MKKKLLICGASGFIGRNMAEHFAARGEFEVYGTYLNSAPPQIPGVRMIRADLTDRAQVTAAVTDKDVIVQAAATTSGAKDIVTRPYHHVTDNAVMNSLLFRAAHEQEVGHVVFFSCTVMYPSSERPLVETDFDANAPLYPSYFGVGWTKVYIEKLCEFYSRVGKTRYTALRHSNIYGPHDKYDLERSHVFGASVTKVMTAREGADIVVWGTGEEARDVLYVSDLVSAVESAIARQTTPFELVNIGSGTAVPVRELIAAIIRHANKNVGMRHDTSKPTLKTSLCLDCTKAGRLFGWKPAVTLDEGIERTLAWYRAHYPTV